MYVGHCEKQKDIHHRVASWLYKDMKAQEESIYTVCWTWDSEILFYYSSEQRIVNACRHYQEHRKYTGREFENW